MLSEQVGDALCCWTGHVCGPWLDMEAPVQEEASLVGGREWAIRLKETEELRELCVGEQRELICVAS